MADNLSPREIKDVSEATSLAEAGNGSRLRDLVYGDKDFNHHTKILNEMVNENQQHLRALEIRPRTETDSNVHINHLKLSEQQKIIDGQTIITRSVFSDGRPIYNETWNSTKKAWVDAGSCPRPSGFLPPYIKIED